MGKSIGLFAAFMIMCLSLSACSDYPEAGNMADYAGWWVFSNDVPGRTDEPVFFYIEFSAENVGEFDCYDKSGLSIGSGAVDFDGKRYTQKGKVGQTEFTETWERVD